MARLLVVFHLQHINGNNKNPINEMESISLIINIELKINILATNRPNLFSVSKIFVVFGSIWRPSSVTIYDLEIIHRNQINKIQINKIGKNTKMKNSKRTITKNGK